MQSSINLSGDQASEDDRRDAIEPFTRVAATADHSPHRLTTKLSGPGHGPLSYEIRQSATRGRAPLRREVRLANGLASATGAPG
jgi:hypothetical protein